MGLRDLLYELKIKQSDYKKDSDYAKADKQVKELEEKLAELKSRNNLNIIKGSLQDIKFTETLLSSCLYRRNRIPIEKGLCGWLKKYNSTHLVGDQVHIEYVINKELTEYKVYDLIKLGTEFKNNRTFVFGEFQLITLFGSNKFENIEVEFEA